MKARIIHLERDIERKQRLEASLNHFQKIDVHWVNAVDAQHFSTSDVGVFGVKNTVAIRQSHMKCWREFLHDDGNDVCSLILEDDAELAIHFETILYQKLRHLAEQSGDDWDILYCGHFEVTDDGSLSWLWRALSTVTAIGHQEHKDMGSGIIQPRFALGAHAYVISRKGAQRCLDYFERRGHGGSLHVDLGLQMMSDLKFFAILPSIAKQSPSLLSSSFTKKRSFPKMINAHLDQIQNPYGLTYAYMMNVPLCGVLGWRLNGWTIVAVLACVVLWAIRPLRWQWVVMLLVLLYVTDGAMYNHVVEGVNEVMV